MSSPNAYQAALGEAVYRPQRRRAITRRKPATGPRQARTGAPTTRPDWMADPSALPRQPPRPVPHPTPVGEWARRQRSAATG